MKGSGGWIAALAVFSTAAVTWGGPPSALTPSQRRGKAIFLTGESPSGSPITAFFGEARLELPGTAAACGSCHGNDGTGRSESGVVPTNITWKYLTKSYGHLHENGLPHSAFDAQTVASYLVTGVYPGGQRGDPAMPVYEMAPPDLHDLVSYLKGLEGDLDPGLSAGTIRVGTILASGDGLHEISQAMRGVLEAYLDAINAEGGIYGRMLELETLVLSPEKQPAVEKVEAWLADDEPFLLVSSFTPGLEADVQKILAERGVPLIGTFTLYPVSSFALNRNVYYLFPGLVEQARALVEIVKERNETADLRLGLLYPQSAPLDDVVTAIQKSCRDNGWPAPLIGSYSPSRLDEAEWVRSFRDAGVDWIVHLGIEPELRAFMRAAASESWSPHVFASGALAGRLATDMPAMFAKRIFLAYPSLPQDRADWALRDLARLLGGRELPGSHVQAIISSLASAKVAIEAMRRSGRSLSREKLEKSLEALYEFDTGLSPPLTFTRNRRMGANGAYVLQADPDSPPTQRAPVRWIGLQ